MTDAAAAPPKIEFGRVIKGTFGVLKRNLPTFLILILLLLGLPLIPVGLGIAQLAQSKFAMGAGLVGVGYLVLLVTNSLLQAGLIHATVADLNERKASVSECIQSGLRHWLPLVAITLVMMLGILGGMLLLIVPGIMIAFAWSTAVPVRVVERTGVFAALSRSADLTRNNRWRLFGIYMLWAIVSSALQSTLTNLIGAGAVAPDPGAGPMAAFSALSPAYWIVVVATSVLSVMVTSAGLGVIYYELRRVKEGVGPEALAAVFD